MRFGCGWTRRRGDRRATEPGGSAAGSNTGGSLERYTATSENWRVSPPHPRELPHSLETYAENAVSCAYRSCKPKALHGLLGPAAPRGRAGNTRGVITMLSCRSAGLWTVVIVALAVAGCSPMQGAEQKVPASRATANEIR